MRASVTVCSVSVTTMPRSQCKRIFSAKAVLGRMPTAMTTNSANACVPSLNSTCATRPSASPNNSWVCAPMRNCMPRASSDCCNNLPAVLSSWRSISHSATCTTVTDMPRFIKPLAASRPNKPPPITTACLYFCAASIMAWVSAISRYASTPSSSRPGIGSMKGLEPVAKINRS